MAAGDLHISAKFVSLLPLTSLPALWASDTIKVALITNAVTPTVNDSDPRWGAGGSQDYSTAEVTPGGNYSAGGIALSGNTVTLSGAVTSLNATSPGCNFASNASNPTGAYWAVYYSSTDSGKHVIGFEDVGGPLSTVAGFGLKFNSSSSGTQPVFQFTAA